MLKTGIITAALIGFAVTAVSGIWLVPYLRRLKYGQTILEEGPNWHMKKQGTPTMGGFMMLLGVVMAVVAGFIVGVPEMDFIMDRVIIMRMIGGIIMAIGFGMIGFFDDYVKVSKKQNLGLTAIQKLILQFGVAAAYMLTLYNAGDHSTIVQIPFLFQIDFGILYYPLCVIGIAYIVNAVNITDGLDGLAASITFVSACGFIVMAVMLDLYPIVILSVATAASCLGFLLWNFYPAKVFMGDTGSMFLGGLVVAMAFGLGMPIILLFSGIIYICESLSVVIQVAYFKATKGKRLFKMSPIHHHFEMSGWNEVKIVFVFSLITLIGSAISVLSIIYL